ncbi:uncharacterized protein LOC141569556 isoform X1 [Rhinolophus sinicus]|uniref:uncharacterized protein LOC141569556 isoform X1 n=2 Tax=Rhinolophus sinicus TaxID=89399 RepID=UPI003D7BB820
MMNVKLLCKQCSPPVMDYGDLGPQTQKQWLSSSSLTPSIPPLAIFNDIPWLVSMSGNCQGIVLSPWWILSTANCLQKMEPSHLNISGVIDSESILHSQKICLHPSFNPQVEKHPAKADIGVVLLEEPIYEDDVSLSQAPNISLKGCSKCHYEICQVYQFQSYKEFGTTKVKKLSVRLLEFSMCHHQHSHLAETEGLCIQSQLQQDCWVQQASPVLCLLKNHWELMGLTHETSNICYDPTIVIRTTPYFNWMKQFIKASKKQLSLTTSLHCKTYPGSENVPQDWQGHNYILNLTSHRSSIQPLEESLGISPQTKHLKNSSPTFLNSNGADSFSDSSKFFPEKSHVPKDTKFPVEQLWTIIAVVRPREYPRDNSAQYQDSPSPHTGDPWNSLVAKTTEPSSAQTISDRALSYDPSKAKRAEHWDYPVADRAKSLDQIMSPSGDYEVEPQGSNGTIIIGSWAQTTANTAGHFSSLTDNTAQSWAQPITNTGGYWVQHTVYTASAPPSTFPSHDTVGPWSTFSTGKPTNRIAEPQDSLAVNTMELLDPHITDSKWVPLPTGMVEPWGSSSVYYSGRTKDQSVTDSVRSHIHDVTNTDELQILPIATMGESSAPSKVVTHESLEAASGAKIAFSQGQFTTTPSQDQPTTAPSQDQSTTTASQGQYTTIPSQAQSITTPSKAQSSFGSVTQPGTDMELHMQPETKTVGFLYSVLA